MKNSGKVKLNPRKMLWKYLSCSNAMFHLLDHEFDNHKENEENASWLLAGGIIQRGHQCGMIWGGTLAVGAESFRRNNEKNKAIAVAITAAQYMIKSFAKRAKHVNCSDITKVDWDNKIDVAIYTIKSMLQGMIYSSCFNLIAKWTPDAIDAAHKGLSENIQNNPCMSCASEVIKKMGGSDEEAVIVAGLAGGIGLSGEACGALGAVMWYKVLGRIKKNPEIVQPISDVLNAKEILKEFYVQTNSEILCNKITGKQFRTIDDHTEYLKNGGCEKLIDALAKL